MTERHSQPSLVRGARVGPSDLASEANRAQRELEDARQTTIRHEARYDDDIEQAMNAAQEASVVAERAHQALARSVASAVAGASAAFSSSTHLQSVASHPPRPGEDTFFKDSITCMASETTVGFSSELAIAVVKTAYALLSS